eukprot:4951983-Pyramimonas_sp.AAC.1
MGAGSRTLPRAGEDAGPWIPVSGWAQAPGPRLARGRAQAPGSLSQAGRKPLESGCAWGARKPLVPVS